MRARYTLADLLLRLEERVGNNTTFWDEEEVRLALNEALAVWQALTGEWKHSLVLIPATGTDGWLEVPRQITSLTRVKYLGRPLTQMTLFEMDSTLPAWRSAAPG